MLSDARESHSTRVAKHLRLAVVHQSRLFRQCLVAALTKRGGFEPIEIAPEDVDMLDVIEEHGADVVLVQLVSGEPSTAQLVRQITARLPDAAILVLAPEPDHRQVPAALQAGAAGCLLEDSSLDELRGAIEAVSRGEKYFSPQMMHYLFTHLGEVSDTDRAEYRVEEARLTMRELEILRLVAHGHSNKVIARKLSVSIHTVKNHVHRILTKLQVPDRHEAVRRAREWHPLDV